LSEFMRETAHRERPQQTVLSSIARLIQASALHSQRSGEGALRPQGSTGRPTNEARLRRWLTRCGASKIAVAVFVSGEIRQGVGDGGIDVGDEGIDLTEQLQIPGLKVADDDRAVRSDLGPGGTRS